MEKEQRILVLGAMNASDLSSIYIADPSDELSIDVDWASLRGISTDLRPCVRLVLHNMSKVGAGPRGLRYMPEGGSDEVARQRHVLEILLARSFVARSVGGASDAWQLTETGMQLIMQTRCLHPPSRAVEPREGIPPQVMTYLELLYHLEANGWQIHRTYRSDSYLRKNMTPYDLSKPSTKELFLHPRGALRRHYLLALALGKVRVQHGLSDQSYKALCFGGLPSARRRAS